MEEALNEFCIDSRAHSTWEKSIAFSMREEDPSIWKSHPQFKWIPWGSQQDTWDTHLLLTINRKLVHWSTETLSLTRRVLINNQELLATL